MSGAEVPVAVLAGALALDLAFGDPPNRWHPVAWLGAIIAAARRRLACGSPLRLLLTGGAVTVGVAVLAALAGLLVVRLAAVLGMAGMVLEAVALSCCLSVRGLWRAAAEIATRLERGDLAGARVALAFHLVSRPTSDLEPGEVAAAAVESVAENLTDSIVAPALMYLLFGLPGAALYRAVNTADAMVGYRDGPLEYFGKLAARLDDVLNLIPARLAALAVVVAAALTRAAPARAWAVMWRDHGRTASPNAGWTMAAMAGALGVRLVKRDAYALGDGALPTARDVRRSLVVMAVAALVVVVPAATWFFFGRSAAGRYHEFVAAAGRRLSSMTAITNRLTEGVRTALAQAGLPPVDDCAWELPRQADHGDYATNAAMQLARAAKKAPRQIAEAIVRHFPPMPEVERVEVAGPGFLNVFLSPAWCASTLRDVLGAGEQYGRGAAVAGQRVRLEFVSANPTGPLVIVNARAAAVGDSLARLLRAQGADVTTEYYVNDAGTQFEALARSFEARVRQALGQDAPFPENGYPGEYLIELAAAYRAEGGAAPDDVPAPGRLEHFGRYAVARMVEEQRRILAAYGVTFGVWTSEQHDVRDKALAEAALEELRTRGLTYEQDGALWFRSTQFGDDKDRVVRRGSGELTYFAVDIAYHHYRKFGHAERLINLLGPDHHGHVGRMRAAMEALGHPPDALEALIIQLVTLLRDGQPVRMSKRRGEFVLMEELLEEVGKDAARFTFVTRRHDSPLEFDLAVATRQSADNPVYYVQYVHARIASIRRQMAEQGIAVPPWSEIDLSLLTLPEEQQIIKRLLAYPEMVAGAARALEPHRVAFWLSDLAGLFHPYYRAHRVIQDDRPLTLARFALCAAVGQVVRNGLDLLGVSAPESM